MTNTDRFKFRAWDKKEQKMLYVNEDDGNFYYKGNENHCPYYDFGDMLKGLIFGIEDYPEETDFVLMQCTGLKDKNGNLIYEEDIFYSLDNEEDRYLLKVTWDDYFGKYRVLDWGGEEFDTLEGMYDFEDLRKLEITGNIYENPELLEAEGSE